MDRKINKIIIHCSASEYGDADLIDMWHKERGWKGIGYHYVILNEYRTSYSYDKNMGSVESLGVVEKGRLDDKIGAHVRGMNRDSIGICLIGNKDFHEKQILLLKDLCRRLIIRHHLTYKDVMGHYECPTGKAQGKTCPNIDMDDFRKSLRRYNWIKKYIFF